MLGGKGADLDATFVIGLRLPSMMPRISRNWRRTSSTILPAALPTAFKAMEQKTKVNMAPKKKPTRTFGFMRVIS